MENVETDITKRLSVNPYTPRKQIKVALQKHQKHTDVYITIENELFAEQRNDEYHIRVADSVEEAMKLVQVGFEHVADVDGTKIFRK